MGLSLGEKAKNIALSQLVKLAVGFVISTFLGAVFAVLYPNAAIDFFREIGRVISNKVNAEDSLHTFISIYLNNLGVATSAYVLGIFYGIVPWLVVLVNGFILGLAVVVVVSKGFLDPITAILAILPHGIFEIPAILMAAAAGIMLYRGTLKKEGLDVTYASLKLYVLSVTVFLLAAFIEAYVTPLIARA